MSFRAPPLLGGSLDGGDGSLRLGGLDVPHHSVAGRLEPLVALVLVAAAIAASGVATIAIVIVTALPPPPVLFLLPRPGGEYLVPGCRVSFLDTVIMLVLVLVFGIVIVVGVLVDVGGELALRFLPLLCFVVNV